MRFRLILVILISVFGCSKKPPTEPVGVTPTPAPVAAPRPTSELGLFDRLGVEALEKDKGDPSTTKVLEAATKAGLHPTNQQQHLASPVAASYCLGVDFEEHLKTTLCEYTTAPGAAAGAEGSRKALEAIANRTVHVRRATTLTVIELPADAISAAAHEKLRSAFDAL